MLAECVKRGQQQRRRLIKNEDRNDGLPGKDLARRNSQKRIRSTQPVERVRFLTTNQGESSISHPAAQLMRTVAPVLHFFGQLCFGPQQRKLILSRAHHSKDRRPHKEQKGHECRNRVPRQTKDRAPARAAKEKWLTRFYRYAPQIGLRTHGGQGWFHQISCAN